MIGRVLVTGAAGLIGSKVVEVLRGKCEVVALVRRAESAPSGVETIVADLGDPQFTSRLPAKADAVIHLAQSADFAAFPGQARSVFQVNLAALLSLLDWARVVGVSSFVHASTGGIYGLSAAPFNECSAARLQGALSFYYSTKRAAEILAESYSTLFSVAALRFFFVYGPGQSSRMLVPRLANAVSSGKAVTLTGANGMRINPIHVSDAAAATVAAMRLRGNSIVNVAGPEALSIRDIAGLIGETIGKTPVFRQSDESDVRNLLGDISLMKKLLHTPDVKFRDGVAFLKPPRHE